MKRNIRRITLSQRGKEAMLEKLREQGILSEHLSDETIERMAEELAEAAPTLYVNAETGEVLTDEGESTGKTIEELAEELPFGWKMIKGDEDQLSLDIGVPPHEADLLVSTLKVPGFEKSIKGQFPMGARVRLEIEVEIDAVPLKRVRDKDGYITGLHRQHIAVIEGVERADDD